MKKRIVASCILFMGINNTVLATGIPTVDIANIIQTTVTAFENIEQVANQVQQIQNQINQFNQQVKQFESMTGNYNMGQLLNSTAYKDERRFIPKDWKETLALLDGANAAANQRQTQKAARDARTAGERFTATSIYPTITTPDAVAYISEGQQVFTQLGVGQSNYAQSEKRIKNIEDLSSNIDTASDLKAAVDLQNRLLAEQAILMTELIRLQSASHINAAEQRLNEYNRRAADVSMAKGTLAVIP